MPRAAEIIRYTYTPGSGQPALDSAGYAAMLKKVYVPALDKNLPAATYSNGNWELSMADAMINIGVFAEDRAMFDAGVAMWRARVPAYIYLASDGPKPVAPSGGVYNTDTKLRCFWLGSGSVTETCQVPAGFAYQDGMIQETCRDAGHVVMGLEAMVNAAETARLQGLDLL